MEQRGETRVNERIGEPLNNPSPLLHPCYRKNKQSDIHRRDALSNGPQEETYENDRLMV